MIYYTPEITSMLLAMYAEEGRDYHGLNHIKFLLSKANEWYNNDKKNSNLAVLNMLHHAIWWHDSVYSIYNPPGKNEMYSAVMFSELEREGKIDVSEYGIDTDTVSHAIFAAINATAWHTKDYEPVYQDTPYDIVTQLMLDVDLVGFAESFDVVYMNSELIFKEHARKALSRKTLLENNIKFLNVLLARKRIFITKYFFDKYEATARRNIQDLIDHNSNELEAIAEAERVAEYTRRMEELKASYAKELDMSRAGVFNGRRFTNHTGLTGYVTRSGVGTWNLHFDDKTRWYNVSNIDNLTIVD